MAKKTKQQRSEPGNLNKQDRKDKIDNVDMAKLKAGKQKVEMAVLHAQKVAADAKVIDLEYQSLIQHIYIKYGLSFEDSINDDTGEIVYKEDTKEEGK